MSNFKNYTHIEETVQAVQLNAANQADVIASLSKEAERMLLADFQVIFNDTAGHYFVNFRYLTDKVVTKLQTGDYLVRLNAGNYVKFTEEEFEAEYLNTSVDQQVAEADRLVPLKAFVNTTYALHPETGITDPNQLTPTGLINLAKAMTEWYDAEANTITFNFADASITDPTGLADLMEAFTNITAFNENTKFVLNFNNGVKEGKPNQFNFIGLQQLLGELKALGPSMARRITGCTFKSMNDTTPSAITASVTDRQWDDFASDMRMYTSIPNIGSISR